MGEQERSPAGQQRKGRESLEEGIRGDLVGMDYHVMCG